MLELRDGNCYPEAVVEVNVGLACVDGVIAFIAFYQLIRIHSRNPMLGWNSQKVFHLMIGSSNLDESTGVLRKAESEYKGHRSLFSRIWGLLSTIQRQDVLDRMTFHL